MSNMFFNANSFNQNISNWNTSKVKDMFSMFKLARSFNNGAINENDILPLLTKPVQLDINNIAYEDVSNVYNMNSMFEYATILTKIFQIGTLQSLFSTTNMFHHAGLFQNQDLSRWEVSNVENMMMMFLEQDHLIKILVFGKYLMLLI